MFDQKAIRTSIEAASESEMDLSPQEARDVAFHMTDWLTDLEAFVDFCRSPATHSPDRVNAVLLGLLQHAPNHLAAAAKLYADSPVADIFEVGAVVAPSGGES